MTLVPPDTQGHSPDLEMISSVPSVECLFKYQGLQVWGEGGVHLGDSILQYSWLVLECETVVSEETKSS